MRPYFSRESRHASRVYSKLPVKEELFSSAPLSDSEDNDLPSVTKVIVHAGRAQPAIDLTGDDTDHDVVVSWQRKPPKRLRNDLGPPFSNTLFRQHPLRHCGLVTVARIKRTRIVTILNN
jgi:hypothetical protein